MRNCNKMWFVVVVSADVEEFSLIFWCIWQLVGCNLLFATVGMDDNRVIDGKKAFQKSNVQYFNIDRLIGMLRNFYPNRVRTRSFFFFFSFVEVGSCF